MLIVFLPQLWNVDSSACHSTLTHSCAVLSCDFSNDCTKVITGDTEGSVKVHIIMFGSLQWLYPLAFCCTRDGKIFDSTIMWGRGFEVCGRRYAASAFPKWTRSKIQTHRKFDLAVCSTFLPLCTCCIAVSCSSSAPFLAFRAYWGRTARFGWTELHLVDVVQHGLV